METRRQHLGDDDNSLRDLDEDKQLGKFLREELKTSQVEAALLERFTTRESKFRLLDQADLQELLKDYR